jgi:hypothetical protein
VNAYHGNAAELTVCRPSVQAAASTRLLGEDDHRNSLSEVRIARPDGIGALCTVIPPAAFISAARCSSQLSTQRATRLLQCLHRYMSRHTAPSPERDGRKRSASPRGSAPVIDLGQPAAFAPGSDAAIDDVDDVARAQAGEQRRRCRSSLSR